MSSAAIERGDEADGLCRLVVRELRHWRKVSHYTLKIMRAYGDIGVVDDQKFVAGVLGELRKVTHFAVGAETRRALHKANGAIRKFTLQLLHRRGGGIVNRGDAE